MFFTGNDGYENFLVFAPMLSSLIRDRSKKVTNQRLTGISSEKIKPFDTNFEPAISNLANGGVNLKFNSSILVQKSFSSMYSNLILNLFIVDELNNKPRNPANNFTLKNCLFSTAKLLRNPIKSKFRNSI